MITVDDSIAFLTDALNAADEYEDEAVEVDRVIGVIYTRHGIPITTDVYETADETEATLVAQALVTERNCDNFVLVPFDVSPGTSLGTVYRQIAEGFIDGRA